MILESNILELLIERDALNSIQNNENKKIDSNIILTSENNNNNSLLVDEQIILSNKVEKSSKSIEKQVNSLILGGNVWCFRPFSNYQSTSVYFF